MKRLAKYAAGYLTGVIIVAVADDYYHVVYTPRRDRIKG